MSRQSHSLGNFAFLTNPLVKTGVEICGNIIMTGSALFFVHFRWMLDEITCVGDLLFMGSIGSTMTCCATYVMIASPEFLISIVLRIEEYLVIGLDVWCRTTASTDRCRSVGGMNIYEM